MRRRLAMPLYYSSRFTVPLVGGGSFPMERYTLALAATNHAFRSSPDAMVLVEPPLASDADLELVHKRDYLRALFANTLPPKEAARVGLGTWSPAWAERTRAITGATLAATGDALRACREKGSPWRGPGGVASVLAGGTHHAFPSHGEGYCFVNDLAVSAAWALREGWQFGVRRVGILDVDVHQGNGTAACFATDPRVVTVSVHGAKNYPWSSRFPGSYDVDVPDGAGDEVYAALLEEALSALGGLCKAASRDPAGLLRLQRANCFAARRAGLGMAVLPSPPTLEEVTGDPLLTAVGEGEPNEAPFVAKAFARAWMAGGEGLDTAKADWPPPAHNPAGLDLLLLQMGVDALEGDRLGRLKVTREGLKARNGRIFQWAEEVGVPVVVTMGGGYGRELARSAEAHADVFEEAALSHQRRVKRWERIQQTEAAL